MLFSRPCRPRAQARAFAALTLLGAVSFVASTTSAHAQTLDQSNLIPSATSVVDAAIVTGQQLAQTFTVGLTGVLARVDLPLYKNAAATGDITLAIRTAPGGIPNSDNAQSLFETVIPLSSLPTHEFGPDTLPLTPINVSAGNIAVIPGQVLSISLSRTGAGSPPWAIWRYSVDDTYSGGDGFLRSGDSDAWTSIPVAGDAGFQTYVTTAASAAPEPGTLALLALGSLPMVGVVRRRCAR